jgi:hypothetical protein
MSEKNAPRSDSFYPAPSTAQLSALKKLRTAIRQRRKASIRRALENLCTTGFPLGMTWLCAPPKARDVDQAIQRLSMVLSRKLAVSMNDPRIPKTLGELLAMGESSRQDKLRELSRRQDSMIRVEYLAEYLQYTLQPYSQILSCAGGPLPAEFTKPLLDHLRQKIENRHVREEAVANAIMHDALKDLKRAFRNAGPDSFGALIDRAREFKKTWEALQAVQKAGDTPREKTADPGGDCRGKAPKGVSAYHQVLWQAVQTLTEAEWSRSDLKRALLSASTLPMPADSTIGAWLSDMLFHGWLKDNGKKTNGRRYHLPE